MPPSSELSLFTPLAPRAWRGIGECIVAVQAVAGCSRKMTTTTGILLFYSICILVVLCPCLHLRSSPCYTPLGVGCGQEPQNGEQRERFVLCQKVVAHIVVRSSGKTRVLIVEQVNHQHLILRDYSCWVAQPSGRIN